MGNFGLRYRQLCEPDFHTDFITIGLGCSTTMYVRSNRNIIDLCHHHHRSNAPLVAGVKCHLSLLFYVQDRPAYPGPWVELWKEAWKSGLCFSGFTGEASQHTQSICREERGLWKISTFRRAEAGAASKKLCSTTQLDPKGSCDIISSTLLQHMFHLFLRPVKFPKITTYFRHTYSLLLTKLMVMDRTFFRT